MILEGTATMSEALRAVREDPSLKEAYFTTPTPLALHSAGTPNKFRKGNGKGKPQGHDQHPHAPPPAPHAGDRGSGKGKEGKGRKRKGQVVLANGKQLALVSATPDGRQLCYAYNAQGVPIQSVPEFMHAAGLRVALEITRRHSTRPPWPTSDTPALSRCR